MPSPDKCLVQDAFLWPAMEIKSEGASNVANNCNNARKILRWNRFIY